jgi:hypothetical protein
MICDFCQTEVNAARVLLDGRFKCKPCQRNSQPKTEVFHIKYDTYSDPHNPNK